MEAIEIKIDELVVWIVIEPIRVNTDKGLKVVENEFLCYFNLKKPNDFVYGELVKGEDNKPKIFINEKAAKDYVTEILKQNKKK